MLAFNYLLLKYGGNTAIAAYGIIANLALIIQAIYSGIGQGIQPIISHLYGSGQISLSFQTARYAVVTAASLGILFVGIAFLFPTQLIAIFNSDHNAALEAIAKTGIQLYSPAFLVAGISVSLTSFSAAFMRSTKVRSFHLAEALSLFYAFYCSCRRSSNKTVYGYPYRPPNGLVFSSPAIS